MEIIAVMVVLWLVALVAIEVGQHPWMDEETSFCAGCQRTHASPLCTDYGGPEGND